MVGKVSAEMLIQPRNFGMILKCRIRSAEFLLMSSEKCKSGPVSPTADLDIKLIAISQIIATTFKDDLVGGAKFVFKSEWCDPPIATLNMFDSCKGTIFLQTTEHLQFGISQLVLATVPGIEICLESLIRKHSEISKILA